MSQQNHDPERTSSKRYWMDRASALGTERARLYPDSPHGVAQTIQQLCLPAPTDIHCLVQSVSAGNPFLRYTLLSASLCFLLYRYSRTSLSSSPVRPDGKIVSRRTRSFITWKWTALATSGTCWKRRAAAYLKTTNTTPIRSRCFSKISVLDQACTGCSMFCSRIAGDRGPQPSGQDLTLFFDVSPHESTITCEFVPPRYHEDTIRQLIELYWNAMRAGHARPDAPLANLTCSAQRIGSAFWLNGTGLQKAFRPRV